MNVSIDKPVSARPITEIARELNLPPEQVQRAARSMGLLMLRLGVHQEFHVSPVAIPMLREVLAAHAGRRVRA
jgi:hypothetical protein